MPHTLSHTEVLNCSAEDAWECCKHSDKVLPDLLPEYFAKAEILEGDGGPGTLRVLHFGPAIPQARAAKERLDTVDDATKTLTYTVVEGDPRYTNFTGKVHFVATGENQTEATWTGTYDPVGDAGPPEYIKNISTLMFKTFEKAIHAKKTLTHSETFDVSLFKQKDTIVTKEIFNTCTFIECNIKAGSICKMGPAIPDGGEPVERLRLIYEAAKAVDINYKGDPRPTEGTTTATCTATCVPVEEGVAMESKLIVAIQRLERVLSFTGNYPFSAVVNRIFTCLLLLLPLFVEMFLKV